MHNIQKTEEQSSVFCLHEINTTIKTHYGNCKSTYNKAYPTRQQHAAMDLHNNNLGIIIEKETPVKRAEVEKELKKLLGEGESISELKRYYPDLTLRQILIMKKIIAAIENGKAAIIWDKYY